MPWGPSTDVATAEVVAPIGYPAINGSLDWKWSRYVTGRYVQVINSAGVAIDGWLKVDVAGNGVLSTPAITVAP